MADGRVGSGGRIRTSDLWVMSPTSCRCSTPRRVLDRGAWLLALSVRRLRAPDASPPDGGEGGGCPRRPRLPWGRPHSTLRRCAGSRPGSGWDRVGPARSRPRAPRTLPWEGRSPLLRHTGGIALSGDHRSPRLLSARPRALTRTRQLMCSGWPRPSGEMLPRAGAGRPAVRSRPGRKRSQDLRPRPLGRLGSSRLPAVHLPPINPVICRGSYLGKSGDARLGEGFPLRCCQRFARPHVATQRCRLPDNWPTSGASSPVLSY